MKSYKIRTLSYFIAIVISDCFDRILLVSTLLSWLARHHLCDTCVVCSTDEGTASSLLRGGGGVVLLLQVKLLFFLLFLWFSLLLLLMFLFCVFTIVLRLLPVLLSLF
jgi:hypothetical protein